MTKITIDFPDSIIEDMDKLMHCYASTREEWILRAVICQHMAFKQWQEIDEQDREKLK